jgi:hypothetical protein
MSLRISAKELRIHPISPEVMHALKKEVGKPIPVICGIKFIST